MKIMNNEFVPTVTISLDEYNTLKKLPEILDAGNYILVGGAWYRSKTRDEVVLELNQTIERLTAQMVRIREKKLPLFSFNKTVRDIL